MKEMKNQIADLFSQLPLVRRYFRGIGTIFMLHRVYPFDADKARPNGNLEVSPGFLESLIIKLRAETYDFISLDRLFEILQNGEEVKKQIVFTFDDGYKDTYEIAYPMFKKYNIPFTVYVTTSFPEKEAILWWYFLEDLLLEKDEIILSDGLKRRCVTDREKYKLFYQIKDVIASFARDSFSEKVSALFGNYEVDWLSKCDELAMGWEQIKELSEDALVTIAGHTKNHYALNELSDNQVVAEIIESHELIESKINKKVNHFAYPFGSKHEVKKREMDIVKRLKLKTATTARYGSVYHQHKKYLERLPRVMLTEKFALWPSFPFVWSKESRQRGFSPKSEVALPINS